MFLTFTIPRDCFAWSSGLKPPPYHAIFNFAFAQLRWCVRLTNLLLADYLLTAGGAITVLYNITEASAAWDINFNKCRPVLVQGLRRDIQINFHINNIYSSVAQWISAWLRIWWTPVWFPVREIFSLKNKILNTWLCTNKKPKQLEKKYFSLAAISKIQREKRKPTNLFFKGL